MKLHHYAHSSASYRVRIALALKGIDVIYRSVDMPNREQQSGSYAKLNPQALVPCLELDDGTVLGQSIAIIDFLEREFPGSTLYPAESRARAQAQSLLLMIACETSPMQALVVQRFLRSEYQLDDNQVQNWLAYWIRRGLIPIERFLNHRSDEFAYTMGPEPGIVDLFIVPQLSNADRFDVDVSDLTELAKINRTCLAHPAFQAAHPDKWL